MKADGSTGALIEGLRIEGARAEKSCQPNCGRGISGGNDLTVRDARTTLNENQGIGGTGPGLLVDSSEVDANGFGDGGAYYAQDGLESAAGIKSVNSMTVVDSDIYGNAWTGVWCDLECDAFEARRNTITDNGRAGIHFEVSTGPAVFANNTVKDNGWASYVWGRYGGILVVSSQNADIYNNQFGNNRRYAVDVFEDSRSPVVNNIKVHDNFANGDTLNGCDLGGVTCKRNHLGN
jgi:hypothetical protein